MLQHQIYLALSGDSPVYHHSTAILGNYVGQTCVGPQKMLELLELHLGLSGLFPSESERVLAVKEAINQLPPEKFPFSASFANDPLGVSKRLLKLWDSWRMSGWDEKAQDTLPKRMKYLQDMQTVFNTVGDGKVERIKLVIETLGKYDLPAMKIHLIDSLELFPYLFQQLLKKLAPIVEVIDEVYVPQAAEGSDLELLQRAIHAGNGDGAQFKNDHSLQILNFPDDILAANAINSIRETDHWNPVIVSNDNSLLNGLQLSLNKPVSRWQTVSGNGQVSQLFFLATALFKRPVNSSQVLAFLSAPVTPFPKTLARKLLRCFVEKPGFGNDKWNKIIAEHLESLQEIEGNRRKENTIAFWLQNDKYLEDPLLDKSLLLEIYSTLESWATSAAQLSYFDLYREQLQNLSGLCRQLRETITLEGETISAAKFERIQAELFSDVPSLISAAQEGSADTVAMPEGIWSPVQEILWMNAVRYEAGDYLSKYWYQQEKDYFRIQNLPVHDESHENKVYNYGLNRMLLSAKERLVIVLPGRLNGAIAAQPFCLNEWDNLIPLKIITIKANQLLQEIPWKNNVKITVPCLPISLPEPQESITIKQGDYSRKTESFSSLDKLFQHPAQWYMEYRLGLRYLPDVALPAENQLKGTLADRLVERIFNEPNRNFSWWKNEVQFMERLEKDFEIILQEEGLPFLEKKTKRFLYDYKRTLLNSLVALNQFITVNQFNIKAVQHLITGTIGTYEFKGYADLVLEKNGKECIIDLKWAFSSKSYVERLKTGTDLQLALYQCMGENSNCSGYFLLNEGKMFMREDDVTAQLKQLTLVNADPETSAKIILQKAENSLQFRLDELHKGNVEVGYTCLIAELEYYQQMEVAEKNLFPLSESKVKKDEVYKKPPYGDDFYLFYGQIN